MAKVEPFYFGPMVSSPFFFLLFFLAYSQQSDIGCPPYFHTWRGLSADLECTSETCCTRLAENKGRHLCTIIQLCRAVSLQLRHVSTIRKNLLNSSISSTCPHNMVNFGPLTAEIRSGVWGTLANYNGFRVLASLPQRRRSMEAIQTLHDVWPSHGLVALLPTNGILPGAKFTLCPSLAFSYISVLLYARHSSSGHQPNFAEFSKGCHLGLASISF